MPQESKEKRVVAFENPVYTGSSSTDVAENASGDLDVEHGYNELAGFDGDSDDGDL